MNNFNLVPIGTINIFAGEIPPIGWLICDGRTINENDYPELFDIVGNSIPDLRGMFVRGLDNNKGIDPNRELGSEQGDAIRNIEGALSLRTSFHRQVQHPHVLDGVFDVGGSFTTQVPTAFADTKQYSDTNNLCVTTKFNASRVVPTADENRPKNIALNYIIKALNVSDESSLPVTVAKELNAKMITGDKDLLELININAGSEVLGFIQDVNLEKVAGKRYVDQITGKVFLCKNPSHINATTDFISCDIINNTNKIEKKAPWKTAEIKLKAGVTTYVKLGDFKVHNGLNIFTISADKESKFVKGGFIVDLADSAHTWESDSVAMDIVGRFNRDSATLVKGSSQLGQIVNHLYLAYASVNDKTLHLYIR